MTFASLCAGAGRRLPAPPVAGRDLRAGRGPGPGTARRLARRPPARRRPAPSAGRAGARSWRPPPRKGAAPRRSRATRGRRRSGCGGFAAGTGRLPIAEAAGEAGGIKELYRRVLCAAQGLAGRGRRRPRGRALAAVPGLAARAGDPDLRRPDRDGARRPRGRGDAGEDPRRGLEGDPRRGPGHGPEAVRGPRRDRAAARARARGTWPGAGARARGRGISAWWATRSRGSIPTAGGHPQFPAARRRFERGDGGEKLTFDVTFRAPRRVVAPAERDAPGGLRAGRATSTSALPPRRGRPAAVPPGPVRAPGAGARQRRGSGAWRLPLTPASIPDEAARRPTGGSRTRRARWPASLRAGGPAAVGAPRLGRHLHPRPPQRLAAGRPGRARGGGAKDGAADAAQPQRRQPGLCVAERPPGRRLRPGEHL